MRRLPLPALALLVTACATPPVPRIPDAITPGIFLEPESRDTLPAGVPLRPVFDQGLAVTKEAEGFRARLYNDVADYCSIGYGHLVKRSPCDNTESAEFRQGLSIPRATDILTQDMAGAQRTVQVAVRVKLNDAKFAALCDFVFNVGPQQFKTSTLLRIVNAGQFDQVPLQLRRWVRAGGREVQGLKNRREREIALFFDGEPTPRGAPPAGEDLSPLDIRTGR
jgi:GH24 family phage-related lysozyme (muramidase)